MISLENILNKEEHPLETINKIFIISKLGVEVDNIKRDADDKLTIYFSIPETITVDSVDKEIDLSDKSTDNIIKISKSLLTDILFSISNMVVDRNEDNKNNSNDKNKILELMWKSRLLDIFNFKCKIRKGEVWTEEKGINRNIKLASSSIHILLNRVLNDINSKTDDEEDEYEY